MTAPQPTSPGITIDTRLFGTITVPDDAVLHFPEGLPGFTELRQFVLLDAGAPGVQWLQSLEQPSLCFFTARPGLILAGSWPELPQARVIVTLPVGGAPATANLRAPLLIDDAARTGHQWISGESRYATAHPFDLQVLVAPPAR